MGNQKRIDAGAFTLNSAADFAGVSVPTMINWVNRDDFPAFKSGRRWIIPREALVEWLNAQASRRASI